MAAIKNEESVQHIVAELRALVETKSKESGEYKEKMDKLSEAFEKAEAKNADLIAKVNEKEVQSKEIAKKMDELETKILRPNGNGSIKIKTKAEEAFVKGLLQRDKYDTTMAFKEMAEASAHEAIEKKYIIPGLEEKYLRTDSNIDGGYLCPPEWSKEVINKVIEINPIRQISKVITVGTKSFMQPVRNTLAEASYEGEAIAVGDTNSQYGMVEFVNNRLTASVPVTYEMLNDGHYDIMALIQNDVAEQFSKKENYMFLKGDGVGKPFGFMNDTNIPTRYTGTAADVNFDAIKLVTGDLKVGYDPVFLLNRRTVAYLATLKNSIGQYLWQEGSTGEGVPSSLAGYKYYRAIDMDDVGASNYPLIFGDFKRAYQITDRFGIYVIRDDITLAKKAMIQYIVHAYNGGRVLLSEAFVKLQCHI